MSASVVAGAIVTYHPDPILLARNLLAMRPQVDRIFIVDNTGAPHHAFDDLADESCVVIRNEANQGIGAALNAAALLAIDHGADWLLTMDQDSVLPAGYVTTLLSAARHHPQACSQQIASIGAPTLCMRTGNFHCYSKNGGFVDVLITSGNLVKLDALKRIGFFDATYFIDMVDFDLSVRLRRAGYRLLETHDTRFEHNLGRLQRFRFLGRSFTSTQHSASRRYYISRNRLRFAASNLFFAPSQSLRAVADVTKDIVKVLLFENGKRAKIAAILLGIRDFLARKTGPFATATAAGAKQAIDP